MRTSVTDAAAAFNPGASGNAPSTSGRTSSIDELRQRREAECYPQSKAQIRFTSRVEAALNNAIHTDMQLRTGLLEAHAFVVTAVRPSRDRQRVFALWSCHPTKVDACQAVLTRLMGRLRSHMGEALKAPTVPVLDMRYDDVSESRSGLAGAFERLIEERSKDEAPNPVLERATQELQARMQPKTWRKAGADVG